MIETHKGSIWELKTRIKDKAFENYDFTGTNFNSAIFENVEFLNCIFNKTVVAGSKLFFESRFEKCKFHNVDLSASTFGSHQGNYQTCFFIKCNFRGREFNYSRFVECVFDTCKIKKVNFNASSFMSCQFIGPMDDVTFNGIYDTNKSGFPPIEKVDFSKAKFGEFVTFIDCDLSTSRAPDGTLFEEILYHLYEDDARILSTGSNDRIVLTRS